MKINIAVVGQARQGKSALINALLGSEIAEVREDGVCTTEVTAYPHPMSENIVFWDVPGIDGTRHRIETYFDTINYAQNDYDFFIIVTRDVFSDNALKIAEKVNRELNKRFYLVRTHVDESIKKMFKLDKSRTITAKKAVSSIRRKIEKEMETNTFKSCIFKLYLVNNYDPSKYDFPKLQKDICKDAPNIISEALKLTISARSEELIELKYQMFLPRLKMGSLASAATAAVPVPGFGASVDLVILVSETCNYLFSFGLDPKGIRAYERLLSLDEGDLERDLNNYLKNHAPFVFFVRNKSLDIDITSESLWTTAATVVKSGGPILAKMVAEQATSEAVESTLKIFIPVIGQIIAGSISFGLTYCQLKKSLDTVRKAALFINRAGMQIQADRLGDYEIDDDVEENSSSPESSGSNSSERRHQIQKTVLITQNNVRIMSLFSASGAAVPVPALSAIIDMTIIYQQAQSFIYQFNLDQKSVAETERRHRVNPGLFETQLNNYMKFRQPLMHYIRNLSDDQHLNAGLLKSTLVYSQNQVLVTTTSEFVENGAKYVVPFFGSFIAAAVSFGTTRIQLLKLLEGASDAAYHVEHLVARFGM